MGTQRATEDSLPWMDVSSGNTLTPTVAWIQLSISVLDRTQRDTEDSLPWLTVSSRSIFIPTAGWIELLICLWSDTTCSRGLFAIYGCVILEYFNTYCGMDTALDLFSGSDTICYWGLFAMDGYVIWEYFNTYCGIDIALGLCSRSDGWLCYPGAFQHLLWYGYSSRSLL